MLLALLCRLKPELTQVIAIYRDVASIVVPAEA